MMEEEDDTDSKHSRPCSGLRKELLTCLKTTECYTKHGLTPRDCLQASSPGYSPECKPLQVAFFECKRSLLDNRQRFRGKKGY